MSSYSSAEISLLHYCPTSNLANPLSDYSCHLLLINLMDIGTNENLYLFSLHIGSLYLQPEGISSNSLFKTWVGSVAILRPCLLTVSSKVSCKEHGGCVPIIFPALLTRVWSCVLTFTVKLPNSFSIISTSHSLVQLSTFSWRCSFLNSVKHTF